MPEPSTDADRITVVEQRLYSAVLSDVLDQLGFRDQAMSARLRPVWDCPILVGRAHTVLTVDVFSFKPDPYRLEIEAVDTLRPGDVLVASTGPSTRTCFWGELLSTAAQGRGARGAVVDGYIRDVRRITDMRFPVFATGMSPVDSAGRSQVVEYGGTVSCGGVIVSEGDLIVGDIDGLVVIPQGAIPEAIERALAKVDGENTMRDALRRGMSLTDAYAKFGLL